jgi:HEAT repeat protein
MKSWISVIFGRVLLFSLMSTFVLAAVPKTSTLSKEAVEEMLSLPEQNRYRVADKKGNEIYPQLLRLAANTKENLGVRWKSLTLAAHLKRQASVKDVSTYLGAREWYMRNAALVALQEVSPAEAQKAALQLLDDKALVVRSAAVEALGTDLTAETRDRLWEELSAGYNFRKNQSLWVRAQIAQKLALSPEKDEAARFIDMLKEKDTRMYAPCIAALEKITGQIKGAAKTDLLARRSLWLKSAKN